MKYILDKEECKKQIVSELYKKAYKKIKQIKEQIGKSVKSQDKS